MGNEVERRSGADCMPAPAAVLETEIRVAPARCQQEVKGTLALADIVARMPDGRPAPDVAWSQVSGPETETL